MKIDFSVADKKSANVILSLLVEKNEEFVKRLHKNAERIEALQIENTRLSNEVEVETDNPGPAESERYPQFGRTEDCSPRMRRATRGWQVK